MKNNKGFTLVEILAVIVIIGIVATIGISTVSSNIARSRDASVVDLAKNYADSAKTMRAKGTLYYEPKNGEAVLIPYSKVDGNEIENEDVTGYGKIIPSYCYVGIVNNGGNFQYYVNQLDDSSHFINAGDYNTIDEDDIMLGSDKMAELGVKELKAPFTGFLVKYGNSEYSVKAVRAKFDAKVSAPSVQNGKIVTVFDQDNVSGIISLTTDEIDNTIKIIKLKLNKSTNNSIAAKEYTFKTRKTGDSSNYIGLWEYKTSMNNSLYIDLKNVTNESFKFDIKLNNKVVYQDIVSTNKTTLFGQFYSDSKYSSPSTPINRGLSDYDVFVASGKFSNGNTNVVTYNGVKYEVSNPDLYYAIAKKN